MKQIYLAVSYTSKVLATFPERAGLRVQSRNGAMIRVGDTLAKF